MSAMKGVIEGIVELYDNGKTIEEIQKALANLSLNYTRNEIINAINMMKGKTIK